MSDNNKKEIFTSPAASADVSQRRDGGVMKLVRAAGKGDADDIPGHEDKVKIHYVGFLYEGDRNNAVFDSSRNRKEPYEFQISKTKGVVPGLHQAVKTMRRGEISNFFVRSDYGYGKKGCESLEVPPKQHLMYEIEMIDFEGEDISPEEDGSVIKSIMKKGTGYLFLPIGSLLTVSIRGRHKHKLFDSRQITFELGVGDEQGLPEGVEQACQRMIHSEIARVIIQPSYAFGIDYKKFQLPKEAVVEYEVELLAFQKPPEHWEVNCFGKMEQAKLARERGLEYFKKGRFKQALNHFENILIFIEHDPDFADLDKTELEEFLKEKDALLLAGRLNCAACYLKLNKNKSTIEQCTKVIIRHDRNNIKAFFRRGVALTNKGRFEEALKDFDRVVELDPENSSVRKEVQRTKKLQNDMKKKEDGLLREMFKVGVAK